jgi:hypothetical protein
MIYVLSDVNNPFRARLSDHLSNTVSLTSSEEQSLRADLLASGALHYTWLMAEASRTAAIETLRKICPTRHDSIIQFLLPPVHHDDIDEMAVS